MLEYAMPARCRIALLGAVVVVGAIAVQPAHALKWRRFDLYLNSLNTTFTYDRNYVADGLSVTATSIYNNDRFNFGLADVRLTGVSQTVLGYTKRVLPAAEFTSNTINQPITYDFNINTGIQDLNATGSIAWNNNGNINALGFYDLQFFVSNRGTYDTSGFGVIDNGDINFDLGPINVSGNIYIDFIAAVLDPLFVAFDAPNPFAKLSGRATKSIQFSSLEDQIRAKVAAGEMLTDDEVDALITASLTASLFGQDFGLLDELNYALDSKPPTSNSSRPITTFDVPGPATITLLGIGALAMTQRRRRPTRPH
jgi:hypothetical protein